MFTPLGSALTWIVHTLFRGFIAKAQTVVLNLDNAETAALLVGLKPGQAITYSLNSCASAG